MKMLVQLCLLFSVSCGLIQTRSFHCSVEPALVLRGVERNQSSRSLKYIKSESFLPD